MPQILKTEEELRRMILDEVRSYVVCPEGTDVTIRADLIMDGQRMSCRHPEAYRSRRLCSLHQPCRSKAEGDFDLLPSD